MMPATVSQCVCRVGVPEFECPYYGRRGVDFSERIEKFMVR